MLKNRHKPLFLTILENPFLGNFRQHLKTPAYRQFERCLKAIIDKREEKIKWKLLQPMKRDREISEDKRLRLDE